MTTITSLDVTQFPAERLYGPDGKQIDLGLRIKRARPAVEVLGDSTWKQIRHVTSFGFAMANPSFGTNGDDYRKIQDDPAELGWLVGGWGGDRDRYIANAIRKMRPAARANEDTLTMRLYPEDYAFEDVVDSKEDDGSFLWGDFPYGGAVHYLIGDRWLLGAVSCLQEIEDHAVASLILGLIGKDMILTDGKLPE